MVWLLLSVFNVICAFIAEKTYNNNKICCVFSLSLIVVCNTIILGFRDFGVGTDTLIYIDSYFQNAEKIHNIKDLFSDSFTDFDIAFLGLSYVSTLFSNDSQALLVCTEFFIIFFLVCGMYEYKKCLNCNLMWFMILFVLLYQRESVNLMRQYCAIALLFYGFTFFMKKKYIIFLVFQFIAYFFHSSSLIFLIIPIFYVISNTDSEFKYLYAICYFLLIILSLLSFHFILSSFSSMGFFKEIYASRYDELSDFASNSGFGVGRLRYIILLLIVYYVYNKKIMPANYVYMFVVLCVSNMLIEQLVYIAGVLMRTAYYIGIVSILYMSSIFNNKIFEIKMLRRIYIIGLLIIAVNLYNQGKQTLTGGTYIYTSKILGI